jgi:hypothetical protein
LFYLDLFAALHRHQVDYILIGGLALALHVLNATPWTSTYALSFHPKTCGT